MSVAISSNNDQNQVLGFDDESKNPILKGKHVKDGKEILQEIVKDTTEAKAKIAEHLTQVMLEMKKAGLGDPLKTLSQNPSWQNFISTDFFNRKPTTKADDMNMYMEIFKALNASSQASNVDLVGACRQLLTNNSMTAFIEKGSDQDLADMQAKIQKAHDDYEAAKSHESFWDKLWGAICSVLVVIVAVCVAAAVVVATGGAATGAVVAGIALLAAGTGVGSGFGFTSLFTGFDESKATDATYQMDQASSDLSCKTQINQNSISRMQIGVQNITSLTQNFENDKESIESVKKSVVQAMTHAAGSN